MKHILLTTILAILCLALVTPGSAQPVLRDVTLTGKVVDAGTQQPLEFAAVSLFVQADSSLVNGIITDESGLFTLEAPPGLYFLKIEFLGYQPKIIHDLELLPQDQEVDLGMIDIEPQATTLGEVVVEAEAGQVQMALDKKIYNVSKDLNAMGGTAQDILDNVPSVQVDVEGNVSLRGSENVRILIDGKPSGLIGISGTGGLRQLQANLIDRVEVITNPSARYEAEGMAGIINIVLKKERQKGVNGSFDLTTGYPNNHMGAVNLNFRTDKLNLFANTGLSYRRFPGEGSLYQEVYRGDTTLLTQQSEDRERGGWGGNLRLGADYFVNPKNILTTAFTYRKGKENNDETIEYRDYLFSLDNPTDISLRSDDETEDELNLEYALTYRRNFAREGHELVADLRYQDNTEDESSDLREQFFDPDWTPAGQADLIQRSQNKEGERRLIGQVDYVHPFGEEGKFEAGWRSSIRRIKNDYLVEEWADDIWASLPGLSNNFRYDEDIHAAYLIYGNKHGRFSYQLGLRPELSLVTTELMQTGEVNDRRYLDLFPSAHFTYDLPADNAVQISYSRRLRRPRFRDLNPFFSFSDNRNFFTGNPELDPEFTHSIELGHLKYWEEASLSSAIYYRHTDGEIERIRRIQEDGTFLTRPENLGTEDAFGIDLNASFNPYRWWKLDGNGNFFRSITNGENVDESFYRDTYSWFTRVTSRFTIWKKLDAQLRFHYRAPQETTQGKRKSMSSLDLAASMDVLGQSGTLTLSVRDVFNTRRYRFISEGEDFYSEGRFQRRSTMVTLSLNYRLNQSKQNRREGGRREEEDIEEEIQF
jgi:ferric enterobactin receptor